MRSGKWETGELTENGLDMASKRHIRNRQCRNKKRYNNIAAAASNCHQRQKRHPGLGYYHCQVCGFWHVGHRPAGLKSKAIAAARRHAEKAIQLKSSGGGRPEPGSPHFISQNSTGSSCHQSKTTGVIYESK